MVPLLRTSACPSSIAFPAIVAGRGYREWRTRWELQVWRDPSGRADYRGNAAPFRRRGPVRADKVVLCHHAPARIEQGFEEARPDAGRRQLLRVPV